MARFTLVLTIDDDSVESLDDVQYMLDKAWGAETVGHAVSFEGMKPVAGGKFAARAYTAKVDPSSVTMRVACGRVRDVHRQARPQAPSSQGAPAARSQADDDVER